MSEIQGSTALALALKQSAGRFRYLRISERTWVYGTIYTSADSRGCVQRVPRSIEKHKTPKMDIFSGGDFLGLETASAFL